MTQLVQGKVRQFNMYIRDPDEDGKIVALLVRQQRQPSIRIDPFSDPIRISIRVELDADLAGQQNPNRPVTSYEYIARLERAAEEQLTERLEDVVAKSQNELESDFFGLSMRRKGQRGLLGALALCAANAAAFVYLLISR